MSNLLSRRDFLKLAALTSMGVSASPFTKTASTLRQNQSDKKNVLIIVFDALTASNIQLYGYPRSTMPHLNKWAERAIVYHNHFSGGSFTTPGTASILTGALAWKHRAFDYNASVSKEFERKSIFSAFKNRHTVGYSHNPLVNTLFDQFEPDMGTYIPMTQLMLTGDGLIETLFKNDSDISSVSWLRDMKKRENGNFSYSLFLSEIYSKLRENKIRSLKPTFPFGPPSTKGDNYFIIEDATSWLEDNITSMPQPFFTYFHLLPPHYPYKAPSEYIGTFRSDNLNFENKPQDPFTNNFSQEVLASRRMDYDEFILYVDRELDKMLTGLEASGLLDNTVVVFTSDHGEMFERGIWSHSTATLYKPVIRVPLMILEPGRTAKLDIYDSTSHTDMIPTLLHLSGEPSVDWVEGTVMPPFAPLADRNLFSLQARYTRSYEKIREATIMLVRGDYKLVYFTGYKELNGEPLIQLYDAKQDPEEMKNIADSKKNTADELANEVKLKLSEVNEPYA